MEHDDENDENVNEFEADLVGKVSALVQSKMHDEKVQSRIQELEEKVQVQSEEIVRLRQSLTFLEKQMDALRKDSGRPAG